MEIAKTSRIENYKVQIRKEHRVIYSNWNDDTLEIDEETLGSDTVFLQEDPDSQWLANTDHEVDGD